MARARKSADEKDYLDPAYRRFVKCRAGERKAVKVRANRRERRGGRVECRGE